MAGEKKTRILFVCIENSCRSQMAEGFTRLLGGDKIEAFSAGSNPSGVVNPDAIAVMKEVGIDISAAQSKGFADLPVQEFDYVVTMGCQDVYSEQGRGVCPFFPAKKELAWDIPDPKGKGIEEFRKAREMIRNRVSALLTSI